ncbi:hypothetical protein ThrDRAFT_04625 [Frankia casuarinae]|jgi:hypothetical protein|uniref:JAB domain-containing protein n=1 Tax=Frankia casuarinae (strain DSM 45818 / CECT 9043 / HFP020203 / CcI3) TaxID=106370 RepID=Q2JBV7_FRACC|nr:MULTISPECIES: hypothetical protein [Frankia]ABD11235.1 conserved hypothetical protein [Frankia casuarinae]ETA00972.1 hypothetical protein CcI6DRAFT_03582 [Frankia sp. CcI6]EYT89750.1 hypothetical protein ThrDRAFT_04625 [Frankia casuarinae]KDA41911.1 hypothetical protein BMG523Draft_03211 [Frankia sp. BMG5.23]KEZ37411.1 hypothetical protein CEDDRAFT_01037 [Frankia sp. CeD]
MSNEAYIEPEPAKRFVDHAVEEYQRCLASRNADGVPTHLPRASGLLFGVDNRHGITIGDIEFVKNVRDSDADVIAEFEDVIAPQFGDVYRNPGRGFWCSGEDVFQAVKKHEAAGLELIGSIHSHPNWHEIGPQHERTQRLSEKPTRMDEYLFRQSSWPVNLIWYVHAGRQGLAHRVAAWKAGPERCAELDLHIPSQIRDEFGLG